MRLSLGQSVSQRHTQRLSVNHVLVREYIFEISLQLIFALRGQYYSPQATCPSCQKMLTPLEILKGFNPDPFDFTTQCTDCGHRFPPKLVSFGEATRVEIPFYCKFQTIELLGGLYDLTPSRFVKEQPAVYRSAIIHFGTLRNAVLAAGISYRYEDLGNWQEKIVPFLGRMPDTVIAKFVDASAHRIGRMRRKLGIAAFTVDRVFDNVVIDDSFDVIEDVLEEDR